MTLNTVFDNDGGEYIFGGVMHFKASWCDGDTVYLYPSRAIDPATEVIHDPAVTVVQDSYSQSYGWRIQLQNVQLGKDHDIVFKDLRNLVIRMVETGWNGQGPDRGMTYNVKEFFQNVSLETASQLTSNIQCRGRSAEGVLTDFSKFINTNFDLIRLAYKDDGPVNGWYYANITGSLENLANAMIANGRTGGTLTVRYYNKLIKRYNSDATPSTDKIYDCTITFTGSGFQIGSTTEPSSN